MSNVAEAPPINWRPHQEEYPWPVFVADVAEAYARESDVLRFGPLMVEALAGSSIEFSEADVLWSGFGGEIVLGDRTFGDRRTLHAVTTEEMLAPKSVPQPATYAFGHLRNLLRMPTIAAYDRSQFDPEIMPIVAGAQREYELRDQIVSMDDATVGLFVFTGDQARRNYNYLEEDRLD